MKKRWIWIAAAVLLALALLLLPMTRFGAVGHWKGNLVEMEAHARLCMEHPEVAVRYGSWNTRYSQAHGVVIFQVSYLGFGSQSDERGIYYSPSDTPSGLGNDQYSLPEEDGLVFLGEGDNRTYVEKLADHWYWYEMHW